MLTTGTQRWLLCFGLMSIIGACKGQLETEFKQHNAEFTEELLIDRREPPTAAEKLQLIAQELPSLPLAFYERHKHQEMRLRENCAVFPELLKLQFHNNYWQVYRIANLTFYLYGAYYDKRALVQRLGGAVLVRILAMITAIDYKFEDYPSSYCQLWFDEQLEPLIVPVRDYRQIWYSAWGGNPQDYYPTFVECALPSKMRHLVPQTVALVAAGCDQATNNLRVIYEPPANNGTQREFAVCSTGLFNPYRDSSARLIEWLELLRLLGAAHVMLPTYGIHPNATKVLRYYERAGFVSAPGISLARGEPALPHFTHAAIEMSLQNHRLNEMVPLNDCLYRCMYKYEFVVVLDVDEVIMPLEALRSWADVVHYAQTQLHDCESLTSLCFRNVYFPAYPEWNWYSAEVPSYMFMLQHVVRVAAHSDPYVATKCLHNTSTVTAVHNHYPMQWLAGCSMQWLNETAAQLQHYREPEIAETLQNPVIDDAIWRYKEPLVARTQKVLRDLGLLRRVKVKTQDAETDMQNLKGEDGGNKLKKRGENVRWKETKNNNKREQSEKLFTLITKPKMCAKRANKNEL